MGRCRSAAEKVTQVTEMKSSKGVPTHGNFEETFVLLVVTKPSSSTSNCRRSMHTIIINDMIDLSFGL
jgi:hypothetical protein